MSLLGRVIFKLKSFLDDWVSSPTPGLKVTLDSSLIYKNVIFLDKNKHEISAFNAHKEEITKCKYMKWLTEKHNWSDRRLNSISCSTISESGKTERCCIFRNYGNVKLNNKITGAMWSAEKTGKRSTSTPLVIRILGFVWEKIWTYEIKQWLTGRDYSGILEYVESIFDNYYPDLANITIDEARKISWKYRKSFKCVQKVTATVMFF